MWIALGRRKERNWLKCIGKQGVGRGRLIENG